jgi:hypothetical protein
VHHPAQDEHAPFGQVVPAGMLLPQGAKGAPQVKAATNNMEADAMQQINSTTAPPERTKNAGTDILVS